MTICSPDHTSLADVPDGTGRLHLGHDARSVVEGRRWVCEQVRAMGASADVVQVIELLTCELMTNAVKYSPSVGAITLTAELHDDVVDIAVTDDGPQLPVVRRPRPEDLGGRGLLMVEALADRWGVALLAGQGKAVWFHLTLGRAAV